MASRRGNIGVAEMALARKHNKQQQYQRGVALNRKRRWREEEAAWRRGRRRRQRK